MNFYFKNSIVYDAIAIERVETARTLVIAIVLVIIAAAARSVFLLIVWRGPQAGQQCRVVACHEAPTTPSPNKKNVNENGSYIEMCN